MSNFTFPIHPEVRKHMQVQPPPPYEVDRQTGALYTAPPLPESEAQRYANYAAEKKRRPIYIEEDVDDYAYPEDTALVHRLLRIRCMSSDYDLSVILAAARHLLLIDKAEVVRRVNDELPDVYERTLIEVHYVTATEVITERKDRYSGDIQRRIDVKIDAVYRNTCWRNLFEAAGYVVKWGNALNIRR